MTKKTNLTLPGRVEKIITSQNPDEPREGADSDRRGGPSFFIAKSESKTH